MYIMKSTFYISFVGVLIILKIVYVICVFWMLYMRFKKRQAEPIYSKLEYWKERSEILFICGMSFMLIHLFNPFSSKSLVITQEEKISIYSFGWVILLTINWEVFIKESEIFRLIKGDA